MLQSSIALSKTPSLEAPIAIVGFQNNLCCSRQNGCDATTLEFLASAVETCVTQAGIPMSWVRRQQVATVVGLNDPMQTEDPFQVGPKLSDLLGLNQTGLTVEAEGASGMAAMHFARTRLAGKYSFGIALEAIVEPSKGVITAHVALLYSLGEALSQGHQVHAILKSTAMSYRESSEELLNECCQKASMKRTEVLRVESNQKNAAFANMLSWLDGADDDFTEAQGLVSTAGFSSRGETSGAGVSLLLQAPPVAPQLGEDASGNERAHAVACEESLTFDLDQLVNANPSLPLHASLVPEFFSGDCLFGGPNRSFEWPVPHVDGTPMYLSLQHGEI